MALAAIAVATWWWVFRPSDRELESSAVAAFNAGELDRAVQLLERLARRRPNDAELLELLVRTAARRGDEVACLEWLKRSAERLPNPGRRWQQAAVQAFQFHRPVECADFARRAIAASPQSGLGDVLLARLSLIAEQAEELRTVVADADRRGLSFDLDPGLLWMWVVGDRSQWSDDEARNWLAAAIEHSPSPALVAALAKMDWRAGRREAAEAVAAKSPDAWEVQLARAEADFRAGDFPAFARALQSLPPSAEHAARTWWLRGELLAMSGQDRPAIEALQCALERDPFLVEAAQRRGRLMVRLSDSAAGEQQLHRAALEDELIRRCLELLQQSPPDVRAMTATADVAAALELDRWVELVARVVEKTAPQTQFSPAVRAARQRTSSRSPLAAPTSKAEPDGIRELVAGVDLRDLPQRIDAPLEINRALTLENVTDEWRLSFQYDYGHAPQRWLMETLGGGVAMLDYDRDGWLDLFFAQGGRLDPERPDRLGEPCQLFRNRAGRRMDNVSGPAAAGCRGYFHGCTTGDFNNDGFPDLAVLGYRGSTLLWNQGDGTWRADPLEPNDRWFTSAAAADFDGDGNLDLYLAGYCDASLTPELRTCRAGSGFDSCRPNNYPAAADVGLLNTGDGGFLNRTGEWGLSDERGYGLGVIAADFDGDGAGDVFVGNDTTPNFLFWNAGASAADSSRFAEGALPAGVAVDGTGRAEACMGIACGDVDGNQELDLFVTNFHDETCTLYLNYGSRSFEDQTEARGLSNAGRGLMGWGTAFVDFDADGWLDVLVLNGMLHDRGQRPQLYRNHEGRFREQLAGSPYFQEARLGRAVAIGDLDRDGREDAAVSHQAEPAAILRNTTAGGRIARVELVGIRSPRDGTGAVLRARIGDRSLIRLASTQGGYLSSRSPVIHWGLGDAEQIDSLEIQWPSGEISRVTDLPVGGHVLLIEGRTEPVLMAEPAGH